MESQTTAPKAAAEVIDGMLDKTKSD